MGDAPSDDITVTAAALQLPVAAVLVEDGIVVAANDRARSLGPTPGVGIPFTDWFADADEALVAQALGRGTHGQGSIAKLRTAAGWTALHTAGSDGGAQVVLLRDATEEQFARAAVDAVADSTFIIDAAGGNRWRSARLRERSGTSDDVAARTPAGERLHPEDMPLVFETFASVTEAQPLSIVARSRAVDDDDRWEWIEMTVWHRIAHEVLGGYLVQVRNLDEGRTLKTALSDADPDLLSLTDAAPVGIAVTDPAGQIVYRNPAAQGLLGRDVKSFGQTDWLALALPEHRAPLADAFHAALREGEERTVTAAFDEPGETGPRWLRLRVRSQRQDIARPTGVIATIEDVTEQVEARAELKAAEAQMRHLATHDHLTGLPNRAALTDELDRAVSRHDRSAGGLAVLFCDLDGFKPVNDRYGHADGDTVLREVASRLRSVVRDADFVARLGGDEFVVLCEGSGSSTDVVDDLASRLHQHVEQPFDLDGEVVDVGLSIGVAMLAPGASCPADRLLLLADQAMYDAKAAGRGRTCVCWTDRPDISTAS